MVFFDLNIPFSEGEATEREGTSQSEKNSKKNTRLKLAVKAMELGYSGVAYNRQVRGVVSDLDTCSIPLFALSTLLKVVPSFSVTVGFHRGLLGVPLNSPFRQYTRLTVAVDSAVQAAALNARNPALRTYDLVAICPKSQVVFYQACQNLEVDLISLNFTKMLPFGLQLPMVEAAIRRGIYFEVSYSSFISDISVRKQMLQGVQLLVDWTRGKNLIFSSAALTANELRGPNDAANLSTLFGLSIEHAKAAVSRNCRSLLANALRKRHCYEQDVKVERLPPYNSLDSDTAWLGDWHIWDHVSSGEGNLMPLDATARGVGLSTACNNGPESSKGSDVILVGDRMALEEVLAEKERREHVDGIVPVADHVQMEDVLTEKVKQEQGGDLVAIGVSIMDKSSTACNENPESSRGCGVASVQHDILMEEVPAEKEEQGQGDDVTMEKVFVEMEELRQGEDLVAFGARAINKLTTACNNYPKCLNRHGAVLVADDMPLVGVVAKIEKTQVDDLASVGDVMPLGEVLVGNEGPGRADDSAAIDRSILNEPKSGKHKFKRKSRRRTYLLPFWGILKSVLFNGKARLKNKKILKKGNLYSIKRLV